MRTTTLRIGEGQRKLIKRAADCLGIPMSSFLREAAVQLAREVVLEAVLSEKTKEKDLVSPGSNPPPSTIRSGEPVEHSEEDDLRPCKRASSAGKPDRA